jgi:hypothetical protein
MGCHTARGGEQYAGGRPISTPFGIIYSSNLTPDRTGLGNWTKDDFWRAIHDGKSKCVFQPKLGTHSAANWALIPRQTGQRFQRNLDTDAASNWTV